MQNGSICFFIQWHLELSGLSLLAPTIGIWYKKLIGFPRKKFVDFSMVCNINTTLSSPQ